MKRIVLSFVCGSILLCGCSGDYTPNSDQEAPVGRDDARKQGYGKLMGDDILLFGASKKYDPNQTGGSANVNYHLWQAALSVLSSISSLTSDFAGGVITTDWYTTSDRPNERIKVTARITDRVLRADALHVTITKQVKKAGEWVNVISDPKQARTIEDLILTRARELKVKTAR